MIGWPDLYNSVYFDPPVVHSFLRIGLHPLDSALFQIGLRVLLYVIDVMSVLIQDRSNSLQSCLCMHTKCFPEITSMKSRPSHSTYEIRHNTKTKDNKKIIINK